MIPDGRFSRVRFEVRSEMILSPKGLPPEPTRLSRGRHALASLKFAT